MKIYNAPVIGALYIYSIGKVYIINMKGDVYMTFQKMLSDISMDIMSLEDASKEIQSKDHMKVINYYAHINDISKEPLTDGQLQELEAIVDILQILYNSAIGSPISDSDYDSMQETLVNMGIPRLTGTVEINDSNKVSGIYTTLRGTLDKTYYLYPNEVRTNKSRKYLDEWIKSTEALYERKTGKHINLNNVDVILQSKYDGSSVTMEWDAIHPPVWITRGDTTNNRASDVTNVMKQFNDVFCHGKPVGIKFEVMMTEENLAKINDLIPDSDKKYKNSRQIVTSILNSGEVDFKAEYLYPVPLRIIHPGEDIEEIHPDMYEKFPTQICKLKDRDVIKKFANEHRYVRYRGMRLRTDGVVITIADKEICKVLGRDNNINNFEVAYKFTEESAISRVKNIEFYVSSFGYITPVLVVNDVILKGNTINHISLANKERFDELALCYGDEVKVLYDIIPYATIDASCKRHIHGRRIDFVRFCPKCGHELNLNVVQVQCKNPMCPSRIIGNILHYCTVIRIQHIGYSTLEQLWNAGLLKNGIRSLYSLKKKANEITDLEGFGQLKAKKIISEIEAKRRLNDYEFFGALGIEGISVKSFRGIFAHIKLTDFVNMIQAKSFELLKERLLLTNSIGYSKTNTIVDWVKNTDNRKELMKLLNELIIKETYSETQLSKNMIKVVFTGCRPTDEMRSMLENHGYEACDSWNSQARYLVIPREGFTSNKVSKAMEKHIPIITIGNITRDIPGLI